MACGHENGGASHAARVEALQLLCRHARPHYGAGALGVVATIFVVLTRLALPWPLRGMVEVAFPGAGAPAGAEGAVASLCVAFLVLATLSGLAELLQRVWMTRFASHTVHDLRATALASARRRDAQHDPGALVARIVGDSARLKAALSGICVHLTQNGLLLLGVTVLFLVLAPKLGLLLFVSGLVAVALGFRAVDEVTETSLQQRESESRYASGVHDEALESGAVVHDELNRGSARKDVRTTLLVARATLVSHMGVAATISTALWIGVGDVHAGRLAPGELFLFIAYALMMHRRAVRLGRQVARSGKVVANAQRLTALVSSESVTATATPLERELRIQGLHLRAASGRSPRNRLKAIDVAFPAGARVAVLGRSGAGKSSLLAVISGRARPRSGRILWDGRDATDAPETLRASVAYVPEEARLGRFTPRGVLGPAAEWPDLLERLGAARVLKRFDDLDATADGRGLTRGERCALLVTSAVASDASVWALDAPFEAYGKRDAVRLANLLDAAHGRTVIVTLARALQIDRFTHVVVLGQGKVAFMGSPEEWQKWKNGRKALRHSA